MSCDIFLYVPKSPTDTILSPQTKSLPSPYNVLIRKKGKENELVGTGQKEKYNSECVTEKGPPGKSSSITMSFYRWEKLKSHQGEQPESGHLSASTRSQTISAQALSADFLLSCVEIFT